MIIIASEKKAHLVLNRVTPDRAPFLGKNKYMVVRGNKRFLILQIWSSVSISIKPPKNPANSVTPEPPVSNNKLHNHCFPYWQCSYYFLSITHLCQLNSAF